MVSETRRNGRTVVLGLVVAWFAAGPFGSSGALAQTIPGLPSIAPPASKNVDQSKDSNRAVLAPTKDNPQATIATASGPIKTDHPVDDSAVEETLESLLPKYPGVRSVDATVKQGIVELDGQVEDAEVRDQMTKVAMQVEGVRMVVNRLKTDAQVLTAHAMLLGKLREIWEFIESRWLIGVLAVLIVVVFSMLATFFNTYSETLLAPLISNVLLRSVVGSLIGSALVIGGILLALQVLNLTQAVLSILGLAGVVGLALGFAFRDIAENFIASVLLGWRRPFRVGDYVSVAGQDGVVKTLNTRATVLVTLDGKHVRIPNNVIYKEILVNSSASPSSRGTFDVIIPYEVSTDLALDAMTKALTEVDGVLDNPPARALVESLEINGIRLRAYYWMPVTGVDGNKLNSDARLKVKVALQQAGIMPPPASVLVSILGRVPIERVNHNGEASNGVLRPSSVVTKEQAQANLSRDTKAADNATSAVAPDCSTPMQHVLNEAETRVSDEGANLLLDEKPQAATV